MAPGPASTARPAGHGVAGCACGSFWPCQQTAVRVPAWQQRRHRRRHFVQPQACFRHRLRTWSDGVVCVCVTAYCRHLPWDVRPDRLRQPDLHVQNASHPGVNRSAVPYRAGTACHPRVLQLTPRLLAVSSRCRGLSLVLSIPPRKAREGMPLAFIWFSLG